jgi:hypothetical protein
VGGEVEAEGGERRQGVLHAVKIDTGAGVTIDEVVEVSAEIVRKCGDGGT